MIVDTYLRKETASHDLNLVCSMNCIIGIPIRFQVTAKAVILCH